MITLRTACLLIVSLVFASGDAILQPKVIQQDAFTVIGIAARTNSAKEMAGDGLIGKQWERFMTEGLADKVPNRAEDKSIVAMYTDFASDHNGDYTFILGVKVAPGAKIPEGMVERKVAAGKYAVFTSEKGSAPKVVPELWMKINSLPKDAVGHDRTYKTDFEIYDQRGS